MKPKFNHIMNLRGSDIASHTVEDEKTKFFEHLKLRRKAFIEGFDANKKYNPITQFGEWWAEKKIRESITKRLFVEMYLNNGDKRHFWVAIDDVSFIYEEKRFLIDPDSFVYGVDVDAYTATYHEHFSLPIKREVPLHALKGIVRDTSPSIEFLANPDILEKFSVAKLVSMLYDVDDKTAKLEQMALFLLITMIASVACAILTLIVLVVKH